MIQPGKKFTKNDRKRFGGEDETNTFLDSSHMSEDIHYFDAIESEANERKAFEQQYQLNKQRMKEESQRKFQQQQKQKELEKLKLQERLREIDEFSELEPERVYSFNFTYA